MVAQPEADRYWTLDQYLDMERSASIRHEFVGGRVHTMAGSTRRHDRICRNVTGLLDDLLGDGVCQVYTSNRSYDQGDKFDLYCDLASLSDYVLIETRRRSVEVRSRDGDGPWVATIYGSEEAVALRGLGLAIAVATVYRGVAI